MTNDSRNSKSGPGLDPKDDTRERLLDAAEILFCRQGFDRTSVRDLTAEAGCNVAAVNYHFGGKQQLYTEMFRRQMHIVIEECLERIDEVMAGPEPTLENFIEAWVASPLKSMEEQSPRAMIIQLMIREVLNQHVDPEPIVKDFKQVFFARASEVLVQLEPGLTPEQAVLVAFSIESLFFHPMLFMDYYLQLSQVKNADEIIAHIVKFSTAAIRGYAEDAQ